MKSLFNEQLSFAGIDASSPPTDRLFFALFPAAAAAANITQLAHRLRTEQGLIGRPLATDRLHITLHLVGDYCGLPEAIVNAAKAAAATIEAPAFEVVFDRAESFSGKPRNRPFVLRGGDEGLAALKAFHSSLLSALRKFGLDCPAKKFTPHITLLYDDRIVASQPVEAVSWTAREFVLVHSLLGKTQHIPLARFPLQG